MTCKPSTGSTRVLVVDDHFISRSFTVAALRQFVPAVKQATDLQEATAIALAWLPDLLFVDIDLPDGSGLELLERLRGQWPPGRSLPRVIVLTGQRDPLEGTPREWTGIGCILVKPVTSDQLKAAMQGNPGAQVQEERGLGPSQQLRELFRQEMHVRLPDLEQAILAADRRQAAAILHQLIASSAICHESELEACLRALDHAVRNDKPAAKLVQAWRRLSEAVRGFLLRSDTGQRDSDSIRR